MPKQGAELLMHMKKKPISAKDMERLQNAMEVRHFPEMREVFKMPKPKTSPAPPHASKAWGEAVKEVMGKPMKKGGLVKKTAHHLLHKGEMVIPASLASGLRRILRH